jgi:hypothetical protein
MGLAHDVAQLLDRVGDDAVNTDVESVFCPRVRGRFGVVALMR